VGCTPVLPLCAERSGAALAMARLQQRQALVSSSACPSVCTSAAAVEGGPAVGMASSFLGEKVRMTAVSTVAGVRAAGKMVPTTTTTATTLPVVRAVQRDGGVMQGDNKPWVAPRARIFPGAESATETSAVATASPISAFPPVLWSPLPSAVSLSSSQFRYAPHSGNLFTCFWILGLGRLQLPFANAEEFAVFYTMFVHSEQSWIRLCKDVT
jgi:hypothetical protein